MTILGEDALQKSYESNKIFILSRGFTDFQIIHVLSTDVIFCCKLNRLHIEFINKQAFSPVKLNFFVCHLLCKGRKCYEYVEDFKYFAVIHKHPINLVDLLETFISSFNPYVYSYLYKQGLIQVKTFKFTFTGPDVGVTNLCN